MKKLLPLLFTGLFLFLFSNCAEDAPRQAYLKSDDLISLHFNKYQIKDLESIMAFFETEICGSVPTTPEAATVCYMTYGKTLSDKGSFGNLGLSLSLDKQNEMMEKLRPVTYEAIWVDGKKADTIAPDGVFGLKYGGQYANFLKNFGKENEAIQQYADVFEQSGIITPSMIANVLLGYEQFDLEEQRGRLFIAIHYVTLNRMFAEAESREALQDPEN